jgi:hypothetical protein
LNDSQKGDLYAELASGAETGEGINGNQTEGSLH